MGGLNKISDYLDAFAPADGDSSDAGAEDDAALVPAFEARVDAGSDDLAVGGDETPSPAVASGTLGNATLLPANAAPASAAASEAQAAATTVTEPRRAHASTARFAASISPAAAAVRRTHARAPTNARTTARTATRKTSAIAKSAAAMSRWTA